MEVIRLCRRLTALTRFVFRARSILDSKITMDEAIRTVADGVNDRERRFLDKLELAVYSYSRSPYRKLLQWAGCELGDVRKLVEASGLDETLRILANSGVYLTYEEFKCQRPAIRGSQKLHFSPSDFDDPRIAPDNYSYSGGTRGKRVGRPGSSETIAQFTPHWALFLAENDCLNKPLSFWSLGASGPSTRQLACSRFSQPLGPWFISEEMTKLKDRFYCSARHFIIRRAGSFPAPERVPYNRPEAVLGRVVEVLAQGSGMCLNTAPSAAVKLSLAAQRRGASLTGLTFLLGAEPLTPARRHTIEASGALARPLYGSSEASWIGGQCSRHSHPDEVHLLEDNYAVIPAQPDAPNSHPAALLMTSLQPITPKVLLNTDIGDLAFLETRPCECLYAQAGCRKVLHTIRSSDKITEFGVNFAVADVFHVLEVDLPQKFGGTAGDYQLVEAKDEKGLPRYELRVGPRVPNLDHDSVVEVFLTALSKYQGYYGPMTKIWRKAGIVHGVRAEPLATPAGKVLPFQRAK